MKSWKNKLSRNQSASLQDQHSKITASNSSRRSKANKFSTILQFRPINLSIRLSLQLTINLGAFFQPGTTWVAWSANDCNTVVNAPRRFTGFPAVLINGRVIISVRRSVALQWPPRRHADYQPGITTNLSPPVVFHRSRIWVKSEIEVGDCFWKSWDSNRQRMEWIRWWMDNKEWKKMQLFPQKCLTCDLHFDLSVYLLNSIIFLI